MCTVLLPPGDNPIAVNKYIISYHKHFIMDMLIEQIKRKVSAVAAFTDVCDAFVCTQETEGSGLPSSLAKGRFQHSHVAQKKCRKAAK